MKNLRGLLFTLGLVTIMMEAAFAQPLVTANRTIFLPQGPGNFSSPMNVAYHPGFDQYYASSGGSPSYQASVYDSNGTIVNSISPINIDVRAWNYNPNTGLMEVVSYNALNGGTDRGLIEAQLDGSGFYTGGTSILLASMPGNTSSQTMPAYDPASNLFYSLGSGSAVNIVNRTDGTLSGTLSLDTVTAGAGALTHHAIGMSSADGWLIVLDGTNDTAVVFDLAGNYLGTSALDIAVAGSYGMGFANGQLFAWDNARSGWQGYDIGASSMEPRPPALPVPTLTSIAMILMALGLAWFGGRRFIVRNHPAS